MEHIRAKPTIANTAMASANTEYSYELPAGTKEFWIKLRNPGYPLKLCIVETESATTYVNIAQGGVYHATGKVGKITLYFQSTANSMTAEIFSLK